MKLKKLIKENLNSPEEQALKKLADKQWLYKDNLQNGRLEHKNGTFILAPYNEEEDKDNLYRKLDYKPKNKYSVYVNVNKRFKKFWFSSLNAALSGIKDIKFKYR